ncbi:MAG: hypothetical protein ACUVWR_02450 [Anaerolineae bacterium]
MFQESSMTFHPVTPDRWTDLEDAIWSRRRLQWLLVHVDGQLWINH